MRRFIYAVIIVLVIIYNFYVFIFGAIQQYIAYKYCVELQDKLLLGSGLVLAMHNYEDSDKKLPVEKSVEFNKTLLRYRIKEMDKTHISINISLVLGKDSIEYGMKK